MQSPHRELPAALQRLALSAAAWAHELTLPALQQTQQQQQQEEPKQQQQEQQQHLQVHEEVLKKQLGQVNATGGFSPDAAIVNYYYEGDTLCGHQVLCEIRTAFHGIMHLLLAGDETETEKLGMAFAWWHKGVLRS
jgi:alkylated DNA repair dioxygenase AlkB